MTISYSSSYLGILLNREINSYKVPTINNLDSDQLIFDFNNYNIYSYINGQGCVKVAGNTWIDNGGYGTSRREGTGLHANTFNVGEDNKMVNYPLGDYSSTFGLWTQTRRNYEVAMGHYNIYAYAFHDLLSQVGTTPEPQMLFGIGNGTGESTRSNIFSVTDHNVVVSGDSYVGFTWKQGNVDASAYYMSSSNGNLTVAQGIKAQTITASKLLDVKGNLNVDENAVIDSIQINGDSYVLSLANNYLPKQLNRKFISQNNTNYYYPTNPEQYNAYINRLDNEYTIDWIDYYESTFRDSICCFKAFDADPQSENEYSPYNSSEYSSVIEKLDWYINGNNTSQQFILSECYPVYVSANKWRVDNYGSFQIKLQLNTTDSSHTGDVLYLRPCRETYKILAAIAGDVEGWFKNHTTTINGSSFRFRWSPLTQYQDSDNNQDPADIKTKLDFSTRSNHQIYFCIDNAKYYIKTYTGQLKEVDMGTCAPIDLSLK